MHMPFTHSYILYNTHNLQFQGGFQLFVEAIDIDDIGGNDHIDDIYIEATLSPGQSIPQRLYSGIFRVASISLSFTLTCTSLFGPNCADGLCPRLPNPANGRVIQPNPIVEGSVARYICNTGYELIEESTRTCRSGVWSGNTPTCVRKSIDNIIHFLLLQLHVMINVNSHIIQYTCRYMSTPT